MFELLLSQPAGPEAVLKNGFPEVFRFLDLTGVFLNGILGGRLARQKGFDPVGFAVLAIMSALGGGIIRDLMLNNAPPVALTDRYYLTMAIIGAALAWLWKFDGKWSRRALIVCDGLVLGVWAATGTQKALSLGFAFIPSVLMGVITAIGGGMVRDVTAGNVPVVFGGSTLYAIPAVIASILDAILFSNGYPLLGMLTATVVGSGITVMASWRRWMLPNMNDWSISMTPKQWRNFQKKRQRTKLNWRQNKTKPRPKKPTTVEDPESETPDSAS